MAVELWIRDGGGTPRLIKELWIRDGSGTPLLMKELWSRDGGGTPRKIFQAFTVSSGASMSSTIAGTGINPQLILQTDGTTLRRLADNSTSLTAPWGAPAVAGVGSNYWINVTLGAGAGVITGTTGSLVSLSSTYTLTMTAATSGNFRSRSATYTIYSDAGGVNAVGGGSMYFESDRGS